MKRRWKLVVAICLLPVLLILFFMLHKKGTAYKAAPGDIVELSFELDKKLEFGEYYFDLDNGKGSTYPLCYCLTERNVYPPGCSGDVKYIYSNTPGTMCIPLHIGRGRCSVKPISSSGYATVFTIPLEYSWTKPFEKIVMGLQVPHQAPEGARLVIEVTILKQNEQPKQLVYRKYEKAILVQQQKN